MTTTVERINISAQTVREAQAPAQHGASLVLRDAAGNDVALPAEVQRTLLRALSAIAEHGSVDIAQTPEELTSTVAANLLGVSRPTLLRWAREGQIESFKVGSHARFRRADVLQLRQQREMARRAACQELREVDAENDFEFFAD
ncbi:helix-turn-helix domain-containing protein [Kocuria rhizophila]|nr:helix-turn-helix domain-containing protein [Kocuria rhizophila]ASE12355.1 DNA-binding protein [Kocuria rhizophila]VEH74108.1 DNA binding domain, excisionase family [Kocuria rhizophila]